MNRLVAVLLILLFPSYSFATTKEWYNNVQYLTKIPKTSLGDIVRTRPGSGNLLPTVVALASDTSPTVNIASGLISVPLYAYSPVVGMAGQYVIGKGLQAAVDLVSNYNNGVLDSEPTIHDLLDDFFDDDTSTSPQSGDYIKPTDLASTAASYCIDLEQEGKTFKITGATTLTNQSNPSAPNTVVCSMTTVYHYTDQQADGKWTRTQYSGSWRLAQSTWPTLQRPVELTPSLAQQIATIIANEIAANNQTIKDAFKNLVARNPTLAPEPPVITNQDVTYNTTQNTYDNRQEYIDYLTNQYNDAVTNNNTQLANELSQKIQEQQIEQEKEQALQDKETFSPISDDPFQTAYDPGPFDIPARFASFLNNITISPLFSFSSSFFNSLPGGGSPIYTVEAGTYGTHTIDLSETMATGLAVLKTALLLLFGFLSIRVVILKR